MGLHYLQRSDAHRTGAVLNLFNGSDSSAGALGAHAGTEKVRKGGG